MGHGNSAHQLCPPIRLANQPHSATFYMANMEGETTLTIPERAALHSQTGGSTRVLWPGEKGALTKGRVAGTYAIVNLWHYYVNLNVFLPACKWYLGLKSVWEIVMIYSFF